MLQPFNLPWIKLSAFVSTIPWRFKFILADVHCDIIRNCFVKWAIISVNKQHTSLFVRIALNGHQSVLPTFYEQIKKLYFLWNYFANTWLEYFTMRWEFYFQTKVAMAMFDHNFDQSLWHWVFVGVTVDATSLSEAFPQILMKWEMTSTSKHCWPSRWLHWMIWPLLNCFRRLSQMALLLYNAYIFCTWKMGLLDNEPLLKM